MQKERAVNITTRKHINRTRIEAGVTNEQIPIVKITQVSVHALTSNERKGETIQQNFSEAVKRRGMQTFAWNNLLLCSTRGRDCLLDC